MKLRTYGFILVIMMGLFTACSVTKEGRSIKKSINGNWSLQTINTEGISGKFTAKVFNEADFNCFIGSSWNFISNNGTGSYTLVGGSTGCSTLERSIRWTVYEPKDGPKEFQFKRLDEKRNPMDDNNGFRLNVSMLDDNTMQLKSAITFEGKPGNIVYNFVKK
ncbi:MAG: lipocalin-like domain protein [Ferruginibacter sp.]|nr:lipocalin-like domain protein [Ferruginibacter sp.]